MENLNGRPITFGVNCKFQKLRDVTIILLYIYFVNLQLNLQINNKFVNILYKNILKKYIQENVIKHFS